MGKNKKASPEKFYDELIASLWTELLFFIPSKDIPIEFLNEHPKLTEILDIILVMDKRVGPIIYKQTRSNKLALQKGSLLDKNVFKLLKRKSKTNQNEFNYILDKYFVQIEFVFFISDWTHENLTKNDIQNLNDTIKGLFLMQKMSYKSHFESIIKHLYPTKQELPRGNFNVIKTIETHFPDLLKKYDREQLNTTINPVTINVIKTNQSALTATQIIDISEPKRLSKKQPLITEIEAETFLVKSVFGIN